MFLQELNKDEQKSFLELAYLVARSNGVVDETEKKMLDTYKQEMEITIDLENIQVRDLEEILPVFKEQKIKRIVFLEAIAIAFADGIYHEEQKQLISRLKDGFEISQEEYEEFKGWIIKINSLYTQAVELINA